MGTSLKSWLAAVGLATGLSGSVWGQTPPVAPRPMPPAPMPMPPANAPILQPLAPVPSVLPNLPEEKALEGSAPIVSSNPGESPVSLSAPPMTSSAPSTGASSLITNSLSNDCPVVGPNERGWVNYTTLLLWFQPARTPFNLVNVNAPGRPARVALDGEQELGMFITPRFSGGFWLNHDHTLAVSLDGFISEDRSAVMSVAGTSRNNLTLSRPFIEALTGNRTELLVANNDPTRGATGLTGSVTQTSVARFAGAGAHLRRNQVYDSSQRFDVFFGFRYYDLSESITLLQTSQSLQSGILTIANQPLAAGSTLIIQDRSFTRNQFWGAELGSHWEYKFGRGFFSFTPRVALGSIHQVTQIHGETSSTGPTTIEPVRGGLLAAGRGPSEGNIGRFITNRFGLATDMNTAVGFNITDTVRCSLGYQFFYLNNVARPVNQFDQTVNSRVVPGSASFGSISGPKAPNVTFDREGFYAHGASILFEASY
jgi:hypothetical protein